MCSCATKGLSAKTILKEQIPRVCFSYSTGGREKMFSFEIAVQGRALQTVICLFWIVPVTSCSAMLLEKT